MERPLASYAPHPLSQQPSAQAEMNTDADSDSSSEYFDAQNAGEQSSREFSSNDALVVNTSTQNQTQPQAEIPQDSETFCSSEARRQTLYNSFISLAVVPLTGASLNTIGRLALENTNLAVASDLSLFYFAAPGYICGLPMGGLAPLIYGVIIMSADSPMPYSRLINVSLNYGAGAAAFSFLPAMFFMEMENYLLVLYSGLTGAAIFTGAKVVFALSQYALQQLLPQTCGSLDYTPINDADLSLLQSFDHALGQRLRGLRERIPTREELLQIVTDAANTVTAVARNIPDIITQPCPCPTMSRAPSL